MLPLKINKNTLFLILIIICVIDNILTEYLLQFHSFYEASPVSWIALKIPYGLWIWKTFVLSVMWIIRDKYTSTGLCIVVVIMLLVISNNFYWFYQSF